MYNQIENRKGEKLYILTVVHTNEISPKITVDTWEGCKKKFESFCEEVNNDRFSYFKLFHYSPPSFGNKSSIYNQRVILVHEL